MAPLSAALLLAACGPAVVGRSAGVEVDCLGERDRLPWAPAGASADVASTHAEEVARRVRRHVVLDGCPGAVFASSIERARAALPPDADDARARLEEARGQSASAAALYDAYVTRPDAPAERRYLAFVDRIALLRSQQDRDGGRERCGRAVAALRDTPYRLAALDRCARLVGDASFMTEDDAAFHRAGMREHREGLDAQGRETAARERAAADRERASRAAHREEAERCYARCLDRCHDDPRLSPGGAVDPRCADASRSCRRECGGG